MKQTKQPIDLTKPHWNWKKDFGRIRIGWSSFYNWSLYRAWRRSWWLCVRHYRIRDAEYMGMRVGGYWQITILGLNLAYCYRKDFKPTKHK